MDYIAQSPLTETFVQDVLTALVGLREHAGEQGFHIHALIDGAFDEAMWQRRPWRQATRQSLYADSTLSEFGDAAPQLVPMPAEDDAALRAQLEALAAHCTGKPMFSLIASRVETTALRRHFAPFLLVRTEDGLELPIRWADTRVLPALLAELPPAHVEMLCAPMLVWLAPQRDGRLAGWQGGGATTLPTPEFDMLPLGDAEYVRLVQASEADALLTQLQARHSEVLARHAPHVCHQRVSDIVRVAERSGIDASAIRVHLALLSLQLRPDFAHHPAMAEALENTARGGDYAAHIRALPERFWQEAAC